MRPTAQGNICLTERRVVLTLCIALITAPILPFVGPATGSTQVESSLAFDRGADDSSVLGRLTPGETHTVDVDLSYRLPAGTSGVIRLYVPSTGSIVATRSVSGTGDVETVTVAGTTSLPESIASDEVVVQATLGRPTHGIVARAERTYAVAAERTKSARPDRGTASQSAVEQDDTPAAAIGSDRATPVASDTTIVVSPDGDGNYTSIQAAIDAADPGDTVEVRQATYEEEIGIDKNISLIAPDGATLNGSAFAETTGVVIYGDDVAPSIIGFTIVDFYNGVYVTDDAGSWSLQSIRIRDVRDDGLDASGSTGEWTIEGLEIIDAEDDGVDVTDTSGSWSLAGPRVRNVGGDGFDASGSTGEWTVTGLEVDGARGDGIATINATGNWTVSGSRITDVETGLNARGSTGDWTAFSFHILNTSEDGIDADAAAGNWTVARSSVAETSDFGIDATDTTGTWTVRDSSFRNTTAGIEAENAEQAWTVRRVTVTDSEFAGIWTLRTGGDWSIAETTVRDSPVGVFARNTSGDWVVRDTTLRDAVVGVFTNRSTGDWRLRRAALRNYDIGVYAGNTTGAWSIRTSTLTTNRSNATDVNGGAGGPTGDATRNWWGGPAADPDSPVCVGNVDCDDALSERPTVGDTRPTVRSPSITATPGENVTVEFTIEARNTTAEFFRIVVDSLPANWSIAGTDAERGEWSPLEGIDFTVSELDAGDSVTASLTLAIPSDTPVGTYRLPWYSVYDVAGEGEFRVFPGATTIQVTAPPDQSGPLELNASAASVTPGGRTRVGVAVENVGDRTLSNVSVALEPAVRDLTVTSVSASAGEWSPDSDEYRWSIETLEPGERVEPTFTVEAAPVDDGFGPRQFPLRATVDGIPVTSTNATVRIVEPPSPPEFRFDARAGTSLIGDPPGFVRPGDSIPVTFEVENLDANATNVTVRITNVVPIWEISSYTADIGTWNRSANRWRVSALEPGTTATPTIELSIPRIAADGYWPVAAELRVDGRELADAQTVIQVGEDDRNSPPVAQVNVNASVLGGAIYVSPGRTLRFDGSNSYDTDSTIQQYTWEFAGVSDATGPTVARTFTDPGRYAVELTVSDGDLTDSKRYTVVVTGDDDGDPQPPDDGPPPDNFPPSASFTVSPPDVTPGETVTLDARESADIDGGALTYEWDLDDDGAVERTGSVVTTTYPTLGERTVTLTVTDSEGASTTTSQTVSVSTSEELPTARFRYRRSDAFEPPDDIRVGHRLVFNASTSSAPAGREVRRYEWSFGDGTTARGATATHSYDRSGTYTVTLQVTDSANRTDVTTKTLDVNTPEGPTIVDVEPEKSGPMVKGIGMTNNYTVTVRSEQAIRRVSLAFPGTTFNATPTDDERTRWVVRDVDANELLTVDDDTFAVVAVDERGNVSVSQKPLDVVETPTWLRAFYFTGSTDFRADGTGPWRIRSRYTEYPFGATLSMEPPNSDMTWTNTASAKATYTPQTRRFKFDSQLGGGFTVSRSNLIKNSFVTPAAGTQASVGVSGGARVDSVDENQFLLEDDTRLRGALNVIGSVTLGIPEVADFVTVGVTGGLFKNFNLSKAGGDWLRIAPDEFNQADLGVSVDVSSFIGLKSTLPAKKCRLGVRPGGTVGVDVEGFLEPSEIRADGRVITKIQLELTAFILTATVTLADESAQVVDADVSLQSDDTTDSLTAIRDRGQNVATDQAASGVCGLPVSTIAWAVATVAGAIPPAAAPVPVDDGGTNDSVERLTRDSYADDQPHVVADDEGVTAVWSAQDPEKDALNGRDIVVRSRRDGEWRDSTRVTDDDRLDGFPAITTDGEHRTVAWTRVDEELERDDVTSLDSFYGRYEVAVATETDDGWSDPVVITDNALPDMNPVVATTDDGTTMVAWTRDRDGDLSTTADRKGRYVMLDGTTIEASGATFAAPVSDIVAANGGFTLVSYEGTGAETVVHRLEIDTDGFVSIRRSYHYSNVSSVTAIPNGFVAIQSGTADRDPRALLVQSPPSNPEPKTITLDGVGGVDHASVTRAGGKFVLSYSALPDYSNRTRAFYHVYSPGSGWTSRRALVRGLSITGLDVAGTESNFVAAVAGANTSAQKTDLFAVSHRFRPDLDVSATASVGAGNVSGSVETNAVTPATEPVEVGAPTTVQYNVTNTGDRPNAPTAVVVSNETGVVATRTIGSLPVGERVTGTVDVPLGRTGTVRVRVDSADRIDDLNESNDVATAVAARPDLRVIDVEDRRLDDSNRLQLRIRVANDGPIPVASIPYRVRLGNRTTRAHIDGVAANRTWTTTTTVNATGLASPTLATVTLDPADRIDEANENNNEAEVSVLSSDVGVTDAITVYDDPQGARAEFVLRNTDTGTSPATLTLSTPTGSRAYRVRLPAARGPDDAAFRPVSLAIPSLSPGENLTVRAESDGIDADLTDNIARRSVDRLDAAANASATSLTIANASGRLMNGSLVITLALRNTGELTTGELVTVRRAGNVSLRAPVAVPPGTTTVSLRTNATTAGSYTVATATDTATVEATGAPSVSPTLNSTTNTVGSPVRIGVEATAAGETNTIETIRLVGPDGAVVDRVSCNATVCTDTVTTTPATSSWNDSTGSYDAVAYRVVVTDAMDRTASVTVRTPVRIAGDATGDGVVNIFDAVAVGRAWQSRRGDPGYTDAADLNNDGVVNIFDAVAIGRHWQNRAGVSSQARVRSVTRRPTRGWPGRLVV
ncbi:PKD domain-containing protein [Haloplanus rubicundus]|uniref:PKD domain-containing protein n=1 Tax=Haloplanus rubicundus TaxID=1547898 RepID=A0A345E008_9EURY|nr:PKD domain-containing protein [Haloplanus rubicundus]AXG05530.1 PKD domain-containing protein [Haloplanus rubicundus]